MKPKYAGPGCGQNVSASMQVERWLRGTQSAWTGGAQGVSTAPNAKEAQTFFTPPV
jgi:hypothetical protein